jgi:cytochrome P450
MTVQVDPAILSIIEKPGAPAPARRAALPTPPASLPGSLNPIRNAMFVVTMVRRGIDAALEYREQFGDIYRVAMRGKPSVVVWDADEIHRILKNEDQAWSTGMAWNAIMFGGLDARRGNAGMLLTLDFDEHRAARKLVQPAFTASAIEGYLRRADAIFAETMGSWKKRGFVDFKKESRTLLARVAGDIFTGMREAKELDAVDGALADFWNAMVALTHNPLLSPTYRRSRRGLAKLIETFTRLVPERRKNGGEDLFSRMCSAEDLEGLEDEAIARVFITVMFGAFDTTSAGLASMAYLLAKHPEWQTRLREEALAVGDGPLDVPKMRAMKQAEWAWKETLRVLPIAMYVGRVALRDVDVMGHRLKAGTLVAPICGGIGRHPKWWTKPSTFDPERFSPERGEDRKHPGIYNPFGGGGHACVGMQLANMEVKQFWHRMLRTFRIRLAPDYEGHHVLSPFGTISGKVRLALEPL